MQTSKIITVLRPKTINDTRDRLKDVRDRLSAILPEQSKSILEGQIREIKFAKENEFTGDCKLDDKDKSVLLVKSNTGSRITSEVIDLLGLRDKLDSVNGKPLSTEEYEVESTERFLGLSDYEEKVSNSLKNTKEILARAYGRRTGMFSWVLLFVLQKFGFENDDFTPIQESLNDHDFIQNFTKYYSIVKNNTKEEGEKFLKETFKDDSTKQQLARLVLLNMSICDKLSNKFIQRFPIIFSIQNLLMPILAWFVKSGPIGRFFDFMRLINPWISEFIAEPVGIFKAEIGEIKKNIPRTQKTEYKNKEANGEIVIDKIELKDLNLKQHKLQKIARKVDAAFERLFGRKTTLSSWIVTGILNYLKFDDYKSFSEPIIGNNKFIQKLYSHLEEVSIKGNELRSLNEKFNEVKEEKFVGGIISGVISIANAMSDKFLRNAPRYFGLPYSFQYLLMPIITKFIRNDSFIGKILALIRDINPIINDIFLDPTATFQEEIAAIKDVSKDIPELIPQRKMPKTVTNFFERIKSFWQSTKGFFVRKPQTT